MPEERLQKILARAGIASRREAEELIRLRRVTVNGDVAELGAKADPARDLIRVDGQLVSFKAAAPVYIALYKPTGVISAARAQRQEKRPTVLDLVHVAERVYPVGRLDADSEGLILLTNDGALTQRITHPRYGHRKTYHVLVNGHVEDATLDRWRYGVELDDGPSGPADVRILRQEGGSTWLEIVMGEGRKRQIRRTAAALHLHVVRLIRIRIGALDLGDMKPGEWRYLSEDEVAQLKRNPAALKGAFARRPRRAAREKPGAKAEDRPARPSRPKPRRKDDSSAAEHPPRKPPAPRPDKPSHRRDEDRDTHRPPRGPAGRRPVGGGSRRPEKKPGRR